MKTSNKIIVSFFTITFIFSYVSLFINNKKHHAPDEYIEHIYQQINSIDIKFIHFQGNYHPNSVVLSSSKKKYLDLNFIPSPKNIHIKSDTLYISTSNPFKIELPNLQYFIINEQVHNVFATPAPIEKLHEIEF